MRDLFANGHVQCVLAFQSLEFTSALLPELKRITRIKLFLRETWRLKPGQDVHTLARLTGLQDAPPLINADTITQGKGVFLSCVT